MGLCGKGIWLTHSFDLQRAAEMAMAVEGTHLLIKVGHGPIYFPATARWMVKRVRTLGFHPLAWIHLTPTYTADALKAIAQALTLGYEGVVLRLPVQHITGTHLRPLAEVLENTAIPPRQLYVATPFDAVPPSSDALEILAPLCHGGWMPFCEVSDATSAMRTIDRGVYPALETLSVLWGETPALYPVLVLSPGAIPSKQLIPWMESLSRHGVDFFSLYHAAGVDSTLWPLIRSVTPTCLEVAPPAEAPTDAEEEETTVPRPVYITASAEDTVWGIIIRHGLTREQFWAWNGHLWDSRGLPRDPDYLHAGWRIRVK